MTMAFPSLEHALNKVSNRYLLVVLSAKRARQINRGAAPRVETKYKKPTSTALEEISQAKVEYRMKEEGETKA
jgi:DNA-directed RNA polymerase subunit omega